jgi:endo-1,4-beta-xylanase
MTWHRILLVTVSAIFSLASSRGAPSAPPGGKVLISAAALAPAALKARLGGGEYGFSKIAAVEHPAFNGSLTLNVTKQPPNTWDANLRALTTGPVSKNDSVLIGFWARGRAADGSGGGVAELVFERNGSPYTKSIQYLVETPIDGGWQHFWVRLKSLEDYAPRKALVAFQAGYLPAVFEVGGLEVYNFGDRALEDLPHTPLTYLGREADASWRAEAERRIDRHRKANLTITVVDAKGAPKPGVPVSLKMDRLAFDLGSAVKAKMLTQDTPDSRQYREIFLKHFNLGVIENGLKWRHWDAWPGNRRQTLGALNWLTENEVPVRGHVLVWPGFDHLPEWVKKLTQENPQGLPDAIERHIQEMSMAAGDDVRDWDVLNEVFSNRDLTTALGDQAMVQWFRSARRHSPNTRRFYNDYAGLVRGGFPTGHKAHFEKTLRYLIDQKAPIDGIGIQGHFGSLLTPPHRLQAELERWSALGLDILITEFDVTVPGEQLRADYTRDFMTLCFGHPKVTGIVSWGFWANAHWRKESAFFDPEWTPTPMGREWIKLSRKWRTDVQGKTDANGQLRVHGFLGSYTVKSGAAAKTFQHVPTGSAITLRR